eukprot:380372-Rhodomonas_salina.13
MLLAEQLRRAACALCGCKRQPCGVDRTVAGLKGVCVSGTVARDDDGFQDKFLEATEVRGSLSRRVAQAECTRSCLGSRVGACQCRSISVGSLSCSESVLEADPAAVRCLALSRSEFGFQTEKPRPCGPDRRERPGRREWP